MATFNFKHIFLFIICSILVYTFQFPMGALLLLGLWMQVAVLLWQLPFTKQTQKNIFYLFLSLIPVTLFWGALSDFLKIYLLEGQFLKFIGTLCIVSALTVWCLLYYVFVFKFYEENINLSALYATVFKNTKSIKKELIGLYLFSMMFFLMPGYLGSDYRIVLVICLSHLYLKRHQLQRLS